MAIDPKERLKNIIEKLNEKEAQELLDNIENADPSMSSFEEIEVVHDNIKDRFSEAFHELAQ